MNPQEPDQQLARLSEALSEMRNALVQMSLVLKDSLTDESSTARDEVAMEVSRYLARIREADHQ